MKTCVLIPTYNNPDTLERVVHNVRRHIEAVIVVDDGSHPEARAIAQSLSDKGLAKVHFRATNGGKGAAVYTGLQVAEAEGYTHALQVDADGQHNLEDIPSFLRASETDQHALVLGQPIFDASAPRSRRLGRKVSVFWCMIETLSRAVGDPLCGYRVYPIAQALAAEPRGKRMDFDPEIAVRMKWDGAPILHVPTAVRYLDAEAGGVSHYRGFHDTWLISMMHTRLCFIGVLLLLTWPVRRLTGWPFGRRPTRQPTKSNVNHE
jgi:polyprenyl-phospho-N-acetylgalactosaminyl synthase